MLTRKDFQATADILHERVKDSLVRVDGVAIPGLIAPGLTNNVTYNLIRRMAGEFAEQFKASNPKFDEQKFMQAVFH